MSNGLDFAAFKVIAFDENGPSHSCYCVEEKSTGDLYNLEALDCTTLHGPKRIAFDNEVLHLREFSHPNILRCFNKIDHKVTNTLYLVKEYCNGSAASFIKKCRSSNSFIDESFVWKILYQTAKAVQLVYTKGPPSMQVDLTPRGVNLDDDGNVKLNYKLDLLYFDERIENNSNETQRRMRKTSDTYSLGLLIWEMTSLQRREDSHPSSKSKIPPHYSEDLQSIVSIMLGEAGKRPTIEVVLYHPILVSHVVSSSFNHMTLMANSVTNHTQSDSGSEFCMKCREQDRKLESLRKREAMVKMKEHELKERDRGLTQKEKHMALLERLSREKMARAELFLNQSRREKSMPLDRLQDRPDDLNSSSYSADPGDTSIQPTAAKLDPSRIIRPQSFAPSISSRRSVRFETIPEFEEPNKNEREPMTWLLNKRAKYRTGKAKLRLKGKENQNPEFQLAKTKHESHESLNHSTKKNQDGVIETNFR